MKTKYKGYFYSGKINNGYSQHDVSGIVHSHNASQAYDEAIKTISELFDIDKRFVHLISFNNVYD